MSTFPFLPFRSSALKVGHKANTILHSEDTNPPASWSAWYYTPSSPMCTLNGGSSTANVSLAVRQRACVSAEGGSVDAESCEGDEKEVVDQKPRTACWGNKGKKMTYFLVQKKF